MTANPFLHGDNFDPSRIQGKGRVDPAPMRKAAYFIDLLPLLLILISPIPPQDSNESLDIHNIPIILTLMTTPHQPKQIKSHWYYTFWSIATLAEELGQKYVATGYRALADALKLSIL